MTAADLLIQLRANGYLDTTLFLVQHYWNGGKHQEKDDCYVDAKDLLLLVFADPGVMMGLQRDGFRIKPTGQGTFQVKYPDLIKPENVR